MTLSGWLTRVRSLGQSAPLAVVLLLVANLIPLAGVLFLGWDVATILIAYWLENGIVGVLNVPKILLAAGGRTRAGETTAGKAVVALFFVAHYGIFWAVHGVFVFVLTGAMAFPGLPDPLRAVLSDGALLLAAVALLASHTASLLLNYIGRGEYRTATVGGQMWQPYARMVVLHVTIVLGGVLVIGARQPIALLALLVVLKTLIDVTLHLREHRRRPPSAATIV